MSATDVLQALVTDGPWAAVVIGWAVSEVWGMGRMIRDHEKRLRALEGGA